MGWNFRGGIFRSASFGVKIIEAEFTWNLINVWLKKGTLGFGQLHNDQQLCYKCNHTYRKNFTVRHVYTV